MRKYLIMLAMVLGFALIVARQDQRATDQAARKTAELSKAAVPTDTNDQHPQKDIKDTAGGSPSWYVLYFYDLFRWPSGTTIWVIVLTLLAIAEQTTETRKSADAAKDGAQAALLNAKALINSERPWIDVRPVSHGEGEWRFEASNYGRTPAELVSTCLRFEIVSDLMNGLAEPPLYKDREESYKRFVFPDNPARVGLMSIKSLLGACQEKAEVLAGAKTFILVGRVVYYDVLNRVDPPHETRYCYGWSVGDDTLFSVGPSGYHGHT